MKTSKLIVIFMLVMCITLVSGSSVFANEGTTVNEPNKEQVISSNEDEKESLEQEEAKAKKPGSRAIVNSTWGTSPVTFDESTGVLTVGSGELVSQPYSSYLDNNNLVNKKDVIKIIFEDGVKAPAYSGYLFSTYPHSESRFTNLVGVYGKLDTSKATVMHEMFLGAEKLEEIDVSDWDTSNVKDMYLMFFDADNLNFLNVSNWNTSSLTNMAYMFGHCRSLKDIDVSNWNTSNATTMEGIFYSAKNITTLDVSKWKTFNVTNMIGTFNGALNLTNLDVSNWDTTNVTSMEYIFSYTKSLTSLDVSNWDTSKVTDMDGMFYGASKINSLDVTNWDTSKVIDMSWMFKEATNLAELDVSNWDTSQVTSMNSMFLDASSLTSLDVTNWDTSKVDNMINMLSNVKLETFILGEKSIFNASVNLPAIDTTSGEYTGRWERINPVAPESIYDSSNVFMSNYDGSMTGTYVWQRTSYTITYELNGGINDPSNPLSYAHGVGVDSFADATKVGYDFLGWVDASDNPVTNIPNTETGNKVLYATWQIAIPLPAEVYTITYELDGGTNDLSNPTYYSFGIGVDSFADATKDGYTFLGWKDASNNPITSISDTDTGNKTLYAKWKKNPGNTDDGGTNKNKGNNNNPVDKGKPSTLPQTGDSSSVSAMILLLIGSLITGGYLIIKRKKQ